jgi:hypothetical protein
MSSRYFSFRKSSHPSGSTVAANISVAQIVDIENDEVWFPLVGNVRFGYDNGAWIRATGAEK